MPVLNEMLHKALQDRFMAVAVDRIATKLSLNGINLTHRERGKVATALRKRGTGRISLWRWGWPLWRTRSVNIAITAEDLAEIEKAADGLINKVTDTITDLTRSLEPSFRKWVLKSYPKEIASQQRDLRAFRSRLADRWHAPLQSLHTIVHMAARIAAGTVEEAPESPPPGVVSLLIRRLQARGVVISQEIIALLECGYADGAMARWRTLHEVTVIALFIQEHGEECAKRYLAHEAIENYKSAKRYQAAHARLGYEAVPDDELSQLRVEYDQAKERYGPEFADEYGWAARYLNGLPANFANIEQRTSLDHLRPFYRLASHSVHGGVKGILFSLGLTGQRVILLGPSNSGLADPGQSTGLTLALLTGTLMKVAPTLDCIVACLALSNIATDACQSWGRVHDDLTREGNESATQ